MKTILVTGANGQLGRELRCLSKSSRDRFLFSDITQPGGEDTLSLDICNPEAVRIVCEAEQVDVIINCAAYTDVERAEGDLGMADMLNHKAVASLAEIALSTGATLVHISTDYVFDGKSSRPSVESDEPAPATIYGLTKMMGERAVVQSGCKHIIVRSAWLYSRFGKNFVKTMLELTSRGGTVKVVSDQRGCPTRALDLAKAVLALLEAGASGIVHFAGGGDASWFELAQAVNQLSGHSGRIVPIASSQYPSRARRPAYSVLDTCLYTRLTGQAVPQWKDSLESFLKTPAGR